MSYRPQCAYRNSIRLTASSLVCRTHPFIHFIISLLNSCAHPTIATTPSPADKNVTRPHRKEYGRLSGDDDSLTNTSQSSGSSSSRMSDPFDAIDAADANDDNNHHDMIDPCCKTVAATASNGNAGDAGTSMVKSATGVSSSVSMMSTTSGGSTTFATNGPNPTGDCDGVDFGELQLTKENQSLCFAVEMTTSNRLQAMAISDDDDYGKCIVLDALAFVMLESHLECKLSHMNSAGMFLVVVIFACVFYADESLTCNVCDRAFHCHRQLASHQQKKRHFG